MRPTCTESIARWTQGFCTRNQGRKSPHQPFPPCLLRASVLSPCLGTRGVLFADTETLEDMSQQIIGRALAGDFLKCAARFLQIQQWKFLGDFRFERDARTRERFLRAF